MDISRAAFVEVERPISKEKEQIPYTFFELDAAEQIAYNTFRVQRDSLEGVVRNLSAPERQRVEREVQQKFIDIIQPHFEELGMTIDYCCAYYGKDKKTAVNTVGYRLFEESEPFNTAFKVDYWFSTKDETLSCTSNLHPLSPVGGSKSLSRGVMYDLLKRAVRELRTDGDDGPFFSFKGDFVYFASHRFAVPILDFLKRILFKIGPESLEELKVLHQEYTQQRNRGDISDTIIQQKVFRDAYERKLETELVKAGFKDHKLSLVG